MAEAADVRAYPPPGQLVDVGGYRLHINCVGTGSPTVVIDAGWGDWSGVLEQRVQPEAAKTTRVCTYDRAGMGCSEAGPLPRTAEHFARELHTLLQHAGVPGPYVLVGHSLGGAPVRVFAHAYAADVAGVVLIEFDEPGSGRHTRARHAPRLRTRARCRYQQVPHDRSRSRRGSACSACVPGRSSGGAVAGGCERLRRTR